LSLSRKNSISNGGKGLVFKVVLGAAQKHYRGLQCGGWGSRCIWRWRCSASM